MGPYILLIFMGLYGGSTVTAVEMSGKVACDIAKQEIIEADKAHGSWHNVQNVLCVAKSAQPTIK